MVNRKKKSRRLTTIAKYINEHVEGLRALTTASFSSTDTKYSGSRLRRPGKGRNGTRLVVYVESLLHPHLLSSPNRHDVGVVLDFDNSETYRTNDEVEEWLANWERKGRRNWLSHFPTCWWSRAAVLRGEPWGEEE